MKVNEKTIVDSIELTAEEAITLKEISKAVRKMCDANDIGCESCPLYAMTDNWDCESFIETARIIGERGGI